MAVKIYLPYKFKPRDYQLPVLKALDDGFKRIVWVAHRRSGKDKTFINHTAKAMHQRVGAYYYIFPTYKQAKKVIWNGMDRGGFKFMDHIPELIRKRTDNTDMLVETFNGSIFQLIGSDKIDSLMGANPVGCVFSEWPLQNPAAWDYLRPILAENDGWAAFIYTPRGKNHGYNTLELARAFPDLWFSQVLTVEDTKAIPEDVLAQERVEIIKKDGNDSLYQQEYMCFVPDTDVITVGGVIPIKDVGVGDMVLTHTNRYRKVVKIFKRKYVGDVVEMRTFGNNKNIVCTPQHPIRVCNDGINNRWVEAKNITSWIKHKKNSDRVTFPKPVLGKRKYIPYELLFILGWFITEGNVSKMGVMFSLFEEEKNNIRDLKQTLSKYLGCEVKERTRGGTTQIWVNDRGFADFLVKHCGSGASNKKIPVELVKGWEKELYEILIDGDGSRVLDYKDIYTTTSKTLAYQFQLLSHSIGMVASVCKKPTQGISTILGRKVCVKDKYEVNIYEGKKHLLKHKYNVSASVRSVERKRYEGYVYNLEIQYDNSYTANGRVVHNCSFDVPIQGAYYAEQLMVADDEGRISGVPYDPATSVMTFWDLGIDDSMSIWFLQAVGQELHLIDYYENNGEGINFYIKILKEKPYVYGKHYAPHDIKARELTTGKSRLETAKKLGIDFEVVAKLSIDDGIDAVRMILNRCWFDKVKCEKGLSGLRSYHKEWDEENQVFKAKPKHDWSSHPADAFRTLAVGFEKEVEMESAVEVEVNVDPYE